MIVLLLLVLLLVPAWSMAQGSEETKEPSLAELARSERERRAQLKAIPILTNSDLRKARGFVSTSVDPESEVAEVEEEAEASSEAEETPASTETDPAVWESKFGEARLNLKNAVNRDLVLQLKMNELRNSYLRQDNGVTQARIQQQLLETQQEIERNSQAVRDSRSAVDTLRNEAQADGVSAETVQGSVGELPEDTSIFNSLE